MCATRVVGCALMSVLLAAGCGAPPGDGQSAQTSSGLSAEVEQVTAHPIAMTRTVAKAGGPKMASEAEVRAFLKKMNKGAVVATPSDADVTALAHQLAAADPAHRRDLVRQFHQLMLQLPTQASRRAAGEKLQLAMNAPQPGK